MHIHWESFCSNRLRKNRLCDSTCFKMWSTLVNWRQNPLETCRNPESQEALRVGPNCTHYCTSNLRFCNGGDYDYDNGNGNDGGGG